MQPLIDNAPPNPLSGSWREQYRAVSTISLLLTATIKHRSILVPFYELFTGPAKQILDRYFEIDILKATPTTDAVIGAFVSPQQTGSAYVLLHHRYGQSSRQERRVGLRAGRHE